MTRDMHKRSSGLLRRPNPEQRKHDDDGDGHDEQPYEQSAVSIVHTGPPFLHHELIPSGETFAHLTSWDGQREQHDSSHDIVPL